MGFDLIGKNLDESDQVDTTPNEGDVLTLSVAINQGGSMFSSLDEYLKEKGFPTNTVRFSCSNRYWHTIWGFLKFANQNVHPKYRFIGTESDFEMGEENSGHFINEPMAGSMVICCQNGIKNNFFDKYMDEYSVSDDEKSRCLDLTEGFIDFCNKSGGFYIL